MAITAEDTYVIGYLVLTGVFSLYLSIMALRGRFKGLYLVKGFPFVVPAGIIYTGFPAGIGSLLFAAIALFVSNIRIGRVLIVLTCYATMLSSLVLMVWKPRWLKPWWLRWLEDNYPHCLNDLLEEARGGGKAWERRIRTQEDLEAWAEQVAGQCKKNVKLTYERII